MKVKFTHKLFLLGLMGLLIIPSVLVVLGNPQKAEALSTVWSKNMSDQQYQSLRKDKRGKSGTLKDVQVSVKYAANVYNAATNEKISCGSTVPEGTRLRFEIKSHDDKDISWFATGGIWDSPYGMWKNNAGYPSKNNMCAKVNQTDADKKDAEKMKAYAMYVVAPPNTSITGLNGNSCTGNGKTQTCTMKAGVYNASFNYADTKSYLYGALRKTDTDKVPVCSWGPARPNNGAFCKASGCENNVYPAKTVPKQAIACQIKVVAPNEPPAKPNAAAGACVIGKPTTITMSATDPDNDKIRYAIDWDNNGTVDQYVPSSGYTSSGQVLTANRTYTGAAGSKTVKIKAMDVNGSSSGWSSVSFSCTEPPVEDDPPIIPPVDDDPEDTYSDCVNLSTNRAFVRYGESLDLFWDICPTEDYNQCLLVTPGSPPERISSAAGEMNLTVESVTRFRLVCPNASDEVEIRVLPKVQET